MLMDILLDNISTCVFLTHEAKRRTEINDDFKWNISKIILLIPENCLGEAAVH